MQISSLTNNSSWVWTNNTIRKKKILNRKGLNNRTRGKKNYSNSIRAFQQRFGYQRLRKFTKQFEKLLITFIGQKKMFLLTRRIATDSAPAIISCDEDALISINHFSIWAYQYKMSETNKILRERWNYHAFDGVTFWLKRIKEKGSHS